jgi:hypothetical protein
VGWRSQGLCVPESRETLPDLDGIQILRVIDSRRNLDNLL